LVFPIDEVFGQVNPTITTEITSDIPIVINCPCAEITVTVKNNNPFPESYMVKVIFPNNGFDPDNLPSYFSTIPNTIGDVTTSFIFFEPNETKTFILKGAVTSPNTIVGHGRVSRPNTGQFFASGFNIIPSTFVDIDGTDPANPASLLELINSGILLDQSEACTFDQNPSPSFQSIYVRGTLEIDTDYCFKRNPGDDIEDGPFIMLDTDAKIIVKAGNELIIRRHVLGCIEMWESIVVEEDAKLIVTGSLIQDGKTAVHATHGSVLDIYSSTFRDNYIGVKFEDDFINLPPPYIQLNKFYNNRFLGTGSLKRPYSGIKRPYAGVELIGTGTANFTGTPHAENHFSNMINGIIATNSSFVVKHARFYDIKESIVGDFPINGNGIYLNGMEFIGGAPIVFVESTDGGVNGDPSFLNCDTGIKVIEGNALITGQKMIKVKTGIDISDVNNDEVVEIVGCWIEPIDYGIKLFNINAPLFNRYSNNNIFLSLIGTDGGRGTAIRGGIVNKPEIMRSTIVLEEGKHGIWFDFINLGNIWENSIHYPNGVYDDFYGIRIGGGGALIRCNYIDGNTSLIFNGAGDIIEDLSDYKSSTGIYINNSNVELKCNYVRSNKIGIQAWGASMPSYLKGNDHSHDYISLLLGNYDSNGNTDGNAWIGAQGSTMDDPLHNGNRWLTNNSSNDISGNDIYGAVHFGSDDIIAESIFKVNGDINIGGSSEYVPAYNTPNSNSVTWFEDEINTAFECVIAPANSDCISGIGDPDLMISSPNDSEIKIAQGQNLPVNGSFEKAINWSMGRHLFKKLKGNNDLISADTDMQSFVNSEENSSIGHFYNIDKGIRDAYDIDNDIIPQIESYRDQISAYHQAIYELDSLFNDDTTPSEYQLIVAQKTDLSNSIYPIFILNKNLLDQHSIERKSKIDLIKLENSNIPVIHIFEKNEQLINDIYLSYFTPGAADITDQVINQIKSVASQCPLSGGNAVFRARALLIPYDDKEYDDVALCQRLDSERVGGTTPEARLTVYPNPAYDMVVIEIPKNLILGEESSLDLVNTLGQVVRTEKISNSSLRVEMNVKGLPSGLYSCTLMKNDKPFIYKKIMVINH
jgi:hypothetical protein